MFKSIVLCSIALVGIFAFWQNRTGHFPKALLPYAFSKKQKLVSDEEQAKALEASLLIVGDRHGKHLDRYLAHIREQLGPLFKDIKILNLASEGHGIHRSIKKLEELKTLPPAVLFMGGYDEFYEEKFYPQSYSKIKQNLRAFQDEQKLILMKIFPFLSHFFTESFRPYVYGKELAQAKGYSDSSHQQKGLELRFKIYELEIQRIIDIVQQKGRQLIFATAPVNLENLPGQVCANATSEELDQTLTLLGAHLIKGDAKMAISKLVPLEGLVLSNARFYYLLGRAYYLQGFFARAKKYFQKANSFDCAPQGPHHVLNTIVRFKARENERPLVDFDRMASAHFGAKEIFSDKNFPQKSFYTHFIEELAQVINGSFKELQQDLPGR